MLFSLLVLHTLANPSAAQQSGKEPSNQLTEPGKASILPGDVPVDMHADQLGVDRKNNTYTARGNVRLRQGNSQLRADTILFNANTGELTAKGGVIVRVGGDVIEAEQMSLKLPAGTGVVYNGKLLLTRENIYLEGQKIERLGPTSYHIERGSFTTCYGPKPDWRITGKDLDVTIEGYGTLHHGFLYVRDIPVFYLPWLVYPAKRQRQTGFLVPSLSNSTLRGFDIKLPLFVNLSRSADATIIPRVCTNRAFQTGLEFRYVPTANWRGRAYGEYTYDWKYGGEADPRTHRFYATWSHDQDLFGLARLRVNGNWVSDRDYFDFWSEPFERHKRVRYLESNAVVYKQWNDFMFQAEARYIDDLAVSDNAVTVQNLPIVTGTMFNQQIPYTPFYLSSNIGYDHHFAPTAHRKWLGSRFKADTRLSLPVALGRYLKFDPSATYSVRAYGADYYVNNESIISSKGIFADIFQVDATVFTDFHAIYGAPFLGFQRIKHAVRPTVSFTYRPPPGHGILPEFDETDRIDSISLLNAEISHTLTGRLGDRAYLDLLSFSISQGFDFNKAGFRAALSGEEPSFKYGLTNTLATLTIRPHSLVDLVAQGEYDPVNNRARRYSIDLGLMDHRGDLFRVLHQFTEDETAKDLNRQTNVNVQLKLTSNLDCFFENQYTHQFDFSYFTSLGLTYHPQCWSILLKYSETRAQDPITRKIKEPDQMVFLTLSLYGLGQVYRTTRDWRELLEQASASLGTRVR